MQLTTQQQESYRKLKEYLRAPERRIGERVVERRLGELVGASRTPVRQALIQLAQEGLVEHAPQWGFFVRQPDAEEVSELYEIRLRLESYAARRAATRATPDDLRWLREAVAKMRRALVVDDPAGCRFSEADREFHVRLLEAAHGRWLVRLVNISLLQVGQNPPNLPAAKGRAVNRVTLREHEAILDALERHDVEAAERLITEHLAFPKLPKPSTTHAKTVAHRTSND
ncbi:MAG: GntR family transcriptional regulator [bacterium]